MRPALFLTVRRFWILSLLLALTGCQDSEGIRVTTESPTTRRQPTEPPAELHKYRTLAAMIPVDSTDPEMTGAWWFFKLSGPAERVEALKKDFDQFLSSVQITPAREEPVIWTVPEGWTEVAEIPGRYGTLRPKEGTEEIAVTKFGGTTFENVNRWRTQLGLEPIKPSALDSVTMVRPVNGRLAITVDFVGPTEPKAPRGGLPGMRPAGHP